MTTLLIHRAVGNQTCLTVASPRNPHTAVLHLESATHREAEARGLSVHEFWDADTVGNQTCLTRVLTISDRFARPLETVTITLVEGGKPC